MSEIRTTPLLWRTVIRRWRSNDRHGRIRRRSLEIEIRLLERLELVMRELDGFEVSDSLYWSIA